MGVYVFGEPEMLIVKVGKAQRPNDRERALYKWYGAQTAKLLYFHNEIPHFHSGWIERRAHKYLRPRFHVEGEWFACGERVARAVVRRAVRDFRRHRAVIDREWAERTSKWRAA